MRVTLIHNPVSGHSDREARSAAVVVQPSARDLQDLIEAAGHEVAYYQCAEGSCAEALAAPADLVVAAGGDGSAGRIAKQMVGHAAALTLLPLGTANNIARHLGLADRPLAELVAGWAQATPLGFDVGELWGGDAQPRRFIEGVGAGLFARTMRHIDDTDALGHLRTPEDKLAQALQLLSERLEGFAARRWDLQLDGQDLSGSYLMVEVMNIRFIGPNLPLAPESEVGDGLLDVVLISEAEREHLRRHLATWQRGSLRAPSFTTHRGREVALRVRGGTLHSDDETWTSEDEAALRITLQPQALRVLAPPAA